MLTAARRFGKFLDLEFDSGAGTEPDGASLHLVVHLARAGWVRWREAAAPARLPQRGPLAARLRFEDGAGLDLTEQGTEKRLALYLVGDPCDVAGVARLGVDALDPGLTPEHLADLLAARPGTLKAALSDQSVIAGVGNAYSDEVLHAARLSPSPAPTAWIARRPHASSMGSGRRSGRPWRRRVAWTSTSSKTASAWRCGFTAGPVSRARSAATPSARCLWPRVPFQYCPTCQAGGRVYADRRLSRLLR